MDRPVRLMGFQRPLSLDGFAVDEFYVRTRDNPGRAPLPADPPPDADEIVVTGKAKKSKQKTARVDPKPSAKRQ